MGKRLSLSLGLGTRSNACHPDFSPTGSFLAALSQRVHMVMLVHVCRWEITSMLHRKLWLHYHMLRFIVELVATLGTAALFSYWILRAYR